MIASGEVLKGTWSRLTFGALLEHLAGKMLGGGKTRARKNDLARIGFGCGDQFLHIVGRKIRTRDDEQAGSRDLPDRRKSGQGVIAHIFPGDGGNDLARGHDAERVAVGLGNGHRFIADDATGTRLVLDDDRLAQPGLHRIAQNAPDDVGAAAWPERYDDANWPLRPFLGEAWRCGPDREHHGCDEQDNRFLHSPTPGLFIIVSGAALP